MEKQENHGDFVGEVGFIGLNPLRRIRFENWGELSFLKWDEAASIWTWTIHLRKIFHFHPKRDPTWSNVQYLLITMFITIIYSILTILLVKYIQLNITFGKVWLMLYLN